MVAGASSKAACPTSSFKIVCDIGSPGITFNPYVCLFVYLFVSFNAQLTSTVKN